ncbi:MAG: hypothetical protein NFW16_18720 [Candidatus Accumulibacter sp.]|uniref:S8 family serine peptidase n=1 Tax=Accumulibacter sp. TaxID=2053492 RepID=UPI002584C50D|nr:S8 family serine peptidase [Accumulibacter sp.]MCM8623706.1 hypothetical protein [Accumulibacter sp.]
MRLPDIAFRRSRERQLCRRRSSLPNRFLLSPALPLPQAGEESKRFPRADAQAARVGTRLANREQMPASSGKNTVYFWSLKMSPQSGISTARAQQAQGLLRGMADPATSGLAIEAGTTEAIAAKSSVAVVIGAENSGDNGWSPSFGAQDCRFVAGSFGYSLYNPADPAFDSSHDISIQRASTILAGYTLASRPDLSRSGSSASAALPSLPDGVRVSADKQTVVILDTGVSSAIDNLIYQYDFYAHDSSAATTETHGSIVASQVLAADSEANIVMLKVAADGSGTISLAAADAALDWVAKYAQQLNIAAVNLSFGASSVVSRGNGHQPVRRVRNAQQPRRRGRRRRRKFGSSQRSQRAGFR